MKRTAAAAILALGVLGVVVGAAETGFVTTTFGNSDWCEHKGTMKLEGNVIKFDLSALPAGTKVLRAALVPSYKPAHGGCPGTKVVQEGAEDAKPLTARPPEYRSLDATAVVARWAAEPQTNKDLRIVDAGNADFKTAVLEVSFVGPVGKPLPAVTGLKADHHDGQTFLTWNEPEDVIGDDAPTFETFERAVLDARKRRSLVHRVYRDDKPITPETIAAAKLLREVPEALSCWYLLAVKNTEHPQAGKTKTSPLRGGNLVLTDVVTRYRLKDGAEPMPRATGLAVLTAVEAGKRYYAVTVAVDGREAATALKLGGSATDAVDEKPSKFPAVVFQRSSRPDPTHAGAVNVDGYVCWVEPPYVQFPRPVEVYIPRWKDLPAGSTATRLPLYANLGTYGTTASEISEPIWHGARRYVAGAVTISLAEEGGLWTGQHECIGTLRGYDDGVVIDYDQRRVLAATAWAVEKPDFFIDPERVYVWGQSAGWALRYPDVFAVVMSDGHNNYKTSKEGKKHAWRWGPAGGSKNCLGQNHLDYLDMPKWLRENPKVELPYWIGAPAYGTFPDHCLGDFGFKPWQEFLNAMKQTKRAFAVTWMTNGPGPTTPIMREMTPLIRLHQSLPAFGNCSLDTSPDTDDPKGEYRPKRYDQDFQKRADKDESGGINLHQRWDPATITDEPDRWAVTIWLVGPDKQGKGGAPADSCTTDLTPRRCQRFKPAHGERFAWTVTSAADNKATQSGAAEADKDGLVTATGIKLTKDKVRVEIRKQ
jgi:hypothetical protein